MPANKAPKNTKQTTETQEGVTTVVPRSHVLIAIEGAGPAGIHKESLYQLLPGCADILNKLMQENLVDHPATTTRTLILTGKGRAHVALRKYTKDEQW